MLVKFNDVGEYIEELKKEFGWAHVDRSIMRLTGERKRSANMPTYHLTVVATIKNRDGDILRLDKYIGELWDMPQDAQLLKDYEAVHTMLTAAAKDLHLEDIRAGVFALEV